MSPTPNAATQPPLPYDREALAPHLRAATIDVHYGKHHAAYCANLARLIEGTPLQDATLEEIVTATSGKEEARGVFNNAAQVWNHTFYWQSMKPGGGGSPSGGLRNRIETDFGSWEHFRKRMTQAAASHFGSGWAWLVFDDGKVAVTTTADAHNPLESGQTPLITLDVWEHAYYLDYQNRRAAYIETWFDHLAHWDFAARNLAEAVARHSG